jgi:hypothetical protein
MPTNLLFRSSDLATPNMKVFVDSFHDRVLPSTVVLVKSGSHIFGGYAHDSWTL